MRAALAAAPEQVVRVLCQRKVIGEITFVDGKVFRRDKALPNVVVLMVSNMLTKQEFDIGHFEFQAQRWDYIVTDFESHLAVS